MSFRPGPTPSVQAECPSSILQAAHLLLKPPVQLDDDCAEPRASEITRCGLRETRRYAPKCRTRSKPRRLAHVRAISSISLFIARAPFGFPDAVVAHMLGVEIIDITMIAGDDY